MISLFYMVKPEGKSVAEHYFTDLTLAREAAKQFATKNVNVNYVILAPIEAVRATVAVFEAVEIEKSPDPKPEPVSATATVTQSASVSIVVPTPSATSTLTLSL